MTLRIGLIGLGTVGQGVCERLRRHRALYADRCGRDLRIDAALVRDPSRPREFAPERALLTADPAAFFDVPTDLIVEVAGGIEPARTHLRSALESGRDVVTANKALLAHHAPELVALAESNRRRLLFEAAVAGGVPVIKTFAESLAANRVRAFAGILNGTCNVILTRMASGGGYAQALADARRLGYAEADPTLDVSGDDSMQKLCILASLAFGRPVTPAAAPPGASRGVQDLRAEHVAAARDARGTIKLLAFARRSTHDSVELFNGPMLVPDDSPLARVDHASMALVVEGDALPSLFIAGEGAGRFPTASAVVADILDAARLANDRAARPLNAYPFAAAPASVRIASFPTVAGLPALPAPLAPTIPA